jgi:hypothetical protein
MLLPRMSSPFISVMDVWYAEFSWTWKAIGLRALLDMREGIKR